MKKFLLVFVLMGIFVFLTSLQNSFKNPLQEKEQLNPAWKTDGNFWKKVR